MIDFAMFIDFWTAHIAAQVPDAQSDLFTSKLSRIGVKAPHGTQPAFEQLAKAIASAQHGSGNFMGTELSDGGTNSDMIRAELMVKEGMGYHVAGKVMNAFYNHIGG